MKNALVLVAVLSILGLASQAHAVIPASCVRAPFPAMPTAPIFTATANNGAHQFRVDVWRLRCKIGNGSALLMRITPITVEPRVCSVDFIVEQEVEQAGVGGMPRQEARLQGALRQTNNDNDSFCNILPTATTFAFEPSGGPFNNEDRFRLLILGNSAPTTVMPIPPGVGAQQLQVLLIASGCNPCHIGDQVGLLAIVATPPGAGASVELKAGARFPDGSTISFLEQATLVSVPGASEALFTLFSGPVPGGLPAGEYTIEAAILDPHLGDTIDRSALTRQILP